MFLKNQKFNGKGGGSKPMEQFRGTLLYLVITKNPKSERKRSGKDEEEHGREVERKEVNGKRRERTT